MPALKPYPYDPAKAKKLLAEAGYASGLKLVFNTPSGRYILDKEISEAISGMFNAVGVQTDMKVLEWGTLYPDPDRQKAPGYRLHWMGQLMLQTQMEHFHLISLPESAFSYYSTPQLE